MVTPKRAGTAVVVCWMVAIVVGLTPMLGWNNLEKLQQTNGTIAILLEVKGAIEIDPYIKILNLSNNKIQYIGMINLSCQFDGKKLTRRQFPITPCYAMTIHKSQGATLEEVMIDMSELN